MILTASWLVPVLRPPIRDGFVAIEDGRILAFGSADELGCDERAATIHLPKCAILPGFINAHCHLELTAYAGRFRPQPLWSWFAELIAARREEGAAEREFDGALAGMRRSLRGGVTHIGDIARSARLRRPIADAPLRRTVFVELLALARDEPRTVAELQSCIEGLPIDAMFRAGVSPHTPYTVAFQDVCSVLAYASESYLPWSLHLAETREEVAWLGGDESALPAFFREAQKSAGIASPRCSVAEYLEHLAPRDAGLIVHGNYLDESATAVLARQGHTLVYCPRAHAYYGHRDHPWLRAAAAGVPVVLATDSLASNQSLALLDEVRFVREEARAVGMSDRELMEMITIVPAKAMGLDDLGAIGPGRWADFALFAISAEVADPLSAVLDSGEDPVAVLIAGRVAHADRARVPEGLVLH